MSAHKWDGSGERCVRCGDKDWMETQCSAPDLSNVTELDTLRPHVNEEQVCENCHKRQISTHLASVNRKYWECTHCGEMAAKAVS